ncbi:hypothetical protein J6590_007512 [Homalodisca vitripennis]|nr:hypothetical protein J6590_007512 [Homalodisca vitripennis]
MSRLLILIASISIPKGHIKNSPLNLQHAAATYRVILHASNFHFANISTHVSGGKESIDSRDRGVPVVLGVLHPLKDVRKVRHLLLDQWQFYLACLCLWLVL